MDRDSDTRFAIFDHVPCNTEVHLQLLTPTSPIRLRTHLIGIHPGKAVLLECGMDKHWLAAKPYIKEERSVIVRLLNSGDPSAQVFAFRSNINRLMSSTYSWIVLDYPKNLERVALRQHSRIHVNVMAELCTKDGQLCCSKGHIGDISIKGGAFIGTDLGHSAVEQEFYLKISDNKTGEPFFLPVTIKNENVIDADHRLAQYGLVLDCSKDDAENLVQQVVLQHLNKEMLTKSANEVETSQTDNKLGSNISNISDAAKERAF